MNWFCLLMCIFKYFWNHSCRWPRQWPWISMISAPLAVNWEMSLFPANEYSEVIFEYYFKVGKFNNNVASQIWAIFHIDFYYRKHLTRMCAGHKEAIWKTTQISSSLFFWVVRTVTRHVHDTIHYKDAYLSQLQQTLNIDLLPILLQSERTKSLCNFKTFWWRAQ